VLVYRIDFKIKERGTTENWIIVVDGVWNFERILRERWYYEV